MNSDPLLDGLVLLPSLLLAAKQRKTRQRKTKQENPMVKPIIQYPDPRLLLPSEEIYGRETIDTIATELSATLAEPLDNGRKAVGLAAPQIGYNVRMIAISVLGHCRVLVNPVIVKHSKQMFKSKEGCLSVPAPILGAANTYVTRHKKVTVKAIDAYICKEETFKLYGLAAAVVQHEIDHLNGITIYEHAKQSGII